MNKFASNQKCVECSEHPTVMVGDEAFCQTCLEELCAYCNEDKRHYRVEDIEVCECCDMTKHSDYISIVDNNDGSVSNICDDCRDEHRRQQDESNFPENDDKETESRF